MPMEDTDSMYKKLSSMLLSKSIQRWRRISITLQKHYLKQNAKMSFSIIPTESKSLLQLRISVDNPIPITSELNGRYIKN